MLVGCRADLGPIKIASAVLFQLVTGLLAGKHFTGTTSMCLYTGQGQILFTCTKSSPCLCPFGKNGSPKLYVALNDEGRCSGSTTSP